MNKEIKTVKRIRSELKEYVFDEIQNLPETLKDLEPKDRLDVLVKLMPYALPKNNTMCAIYGEPSNWDFD